MGYIQKTEIGGIPFGRIPFGRIPKMSIFHLIPKYLK